MRAVVIALGMLIIAACSGPPIDPSLIEKRDELPEGRGLLSGDDGAFEVRI